MPQTLLPSDTNLTLLATIADAYDARAIRLFGPVNVTTPSSALLNAMLRQALATAAAPGSLSLADMAQAMLVTYEAAGSGNLSTRSQVLDILDAVVGSQVSVTSETTTSTLSTLLQLSSTLVRAEASAVSLIVQRLANITTTISQEQGEALLTIIARAAAVLQSGDGTWMYGDFTTPLLPSLK
jgi:hypothetical protein